MKEERRVQAQQMRGALQMYELNDVYLQLSKQKGKQLERALPVRGACEGGDGAVVWGGGEWERKH